MTNETPGPQEDEEVAVNEAEAMGGLADDEGSATEPALDEDAAE